MNRSALLSVTGLLVGVSILAGIYLAQPSSMVRQVKQLEGELSKAQSEVARLKSENATLVASKKAEVQPASKGGNQDGTQSANTGAAASPAGTAAAPMDKERMRALMSKINENQFEITYGKLFKKFGLNEEESARFKQLLLDRQNQQTEISMKLMGSKPTKEQAKAVSNEMVAAKKASDAAIREFLGNDQDFEAFKQWDDTKGERMQMQMAATSFDAADASLSSEQREQLVNVLVAARKASAESAKLKTPSDGKVDVLTQVRMREDAMDQSVLQQAASFLSPEQLGILEKTQQRRRDMLHPATMAPVVPGKVGP